MNNPELEIAERFVKYTNRNIFLTGKAGTGKTTFLKSLRYKTQKRMAIVAPTGVAAINAGGVTIHSFFQLPFGPILTERVTGQKIESQAFKQKFNKTKINILKTLDLLVIDEISMVRADILDAIDQILRKYKNHYLPFGGAQLLMIGDLQQLAPVIKQDEVYLLKPYYQSMYFFNSHALKDANMITVELKHIYRQKDDTFVQILNEIRDDRLTENSYNLLHERYIPEFKPANKGYITLTTHNRIADEINFEKLNQIEKKSYFFKAHVDGIFPEHSYPTDFKIELKVGAQVMFIKNDSALEKRYFNGKIGEIIDFEDNMIIVKCDDDEIIETGKETWENIRYNINPKTKEIEEEYIGSFTQYPLRLAWAITIHKSQGLTFEKAVIDAADAFAHGQTYVALSRCKTLEGLVLSSKISKSAIICDAEVRTFNKKAEENQPDENVLQNSINSYQAELLNELFNYKQLSYRFNIFAKKLKEYSGNYSGDIGLAIFEIDKDALPKISAVATKFLKQITSILKENPDVEKNEKLQERLKEAGKYFTDFHDNEIIKKLENRSFESDNATVEKEIKDSLASVNEILNIKQHGLKVCISGFKIKDYLDARAKASIEKKIIKQDIKIKDTKTEHPELYAILKAWRQSEADEQNVALYNIVPNKSLKQIANTLPITKKQLLSISGIGKYKLNQFGSDILSIVADYLIDKNIKPKLDEPETPKQQKKKNWEISFEMYKQGKTIEEIAHAQGFVISTIENHLARFVETGEIKITELVDNQSIEKIFNYFEKNENAQLSDAKSVLPEKITYSQIKLVLKHREFLKNDKP